MKASKVWFGQGEWEVRVPALVFRVEKVSGEWWLYSYLDDAEEDLVQPSVHKTESAAKRRARKIYADWLRGHLKMVEGKS